MTTSSLDIEQARLLRTTVPRYTSYPTAPHFHDGIGELQYREWLGQLPADEPVSAYVHIPFCDKLCWFCGCTTKQIQRYDPVPVYLEALYEEISLLRTGLGRRSNLDRLHLGGGSPSMLKAPDLNRLRRALEGTFQFNGNTEISIEIDPSDVMSHSYAAFRDFGISRASIGVQDFDPRVQAAINRPQSFRQTADCVEGLREIGVASLNIDALYGLPYQTTKSVLNSLEQVISLKPDRIALFGYAHVPWLKKHQRLIPEEALPDPEARFEQATHAEAMLLASEYEKIGIDHFALPGDELAIAARQGRLRRNFQGYTADDCRTLLGLGASSISSLKHGYVQNEPATGSYIRIVRAGHLPVARGVMRTNDDQMYADVIEQLMCNFAFSISKLSEKHGDRINSVRQAIEASSDELAGLLTCFDGDIYSITDKGKAFTRVIAASFDPHYQSNGARHSKSV